jgi:hypothetical protein
MATLSKKSLAIQFRRKGASYNHICRVLQVPKSTLSGWLKNCRLSQETRKRLMTRNQQRWAESLIRYNKSRAQEARRKAEEITLAAASQIRRLNSRELRLIGTALYWAEGDKGARWRLKFSGSDPGMIKLVMRFFREICRVPSKKFSCQLHLHPHVSEARAKVFWAKQVGLPSHRFIRSQRILSRSSHGKRPVRRLPYGTLHIAIHQGLVRNRVMGWIRGLRGF